MDMHVIWKLRYYLKEYMYLVTIINDLGNFLSRPEND